jgi:hexosaminidase
MTLSLTARIEGREIHCEIGSDIAVRAATFCFSLMAAARVVSGGILTKSVAGYTEVALPDIAAGIPAKLILTHADPHFSPRNRAWLPLGPYLRVNGQTLPLPDLPAGVRGVAQPAAAVPDATLRLIPQPSDWQPTRATLAFTALATDHPALRRACELAQRLHLAPLIAANGTPVQITHTPDMPPEAYTLTIAAMGLQIEASTDHGIFNAAITLLNLRETYDGALVCGTITDAPRFGWRGQHLDCARHFYDVETILRLLDLMALLKLNRFHWHFADDEAFRLEVDTAPALWQKTAFRGEDCAVPGVFGGGIRAGGSYSKADVATILARASALHIEVLPEIEVPAHAFALNKAVPGLRDPADNGAETSVQGYACNIINPAVPATWALLEPLCLEIAALFPIGILHLGCDELPPDAWSGSPAVTALKAEHGLESRDDVQGWMMHRLAAFLADNGIRSAAWEEAAKGANGGIGHNAILFSWTGQGPGEDAARRGHDVVMCPAQHVYFDMAHSADPDDWGATWAATIPLEATINWRPVPSGAEDIAHRIIGVQGCFWSEFTTEDAQMEPMLAPRLLGLANKAWDCGDSLNGPALRALAQSYAPLFDRIGWQRHPGA